MKLGRPKFNSDQLWGKVLLQDLYPYTNNNELDEAGPPAEYNKFYADSHSDKGTKSYINTKLTYQTMDYGKETSKRRKVEHIALTGDESSKISTIGFHRYNTHIVRNMEWFVNLQRYMRYTMRESLNWMDTPVVSGHNVLNSRVTEYEENGAYDSHEFS